VTLIDDKCLINRIRETRNSPKTCGVPDQARNEEEKVLFDFLKDFDATCQGAYWSGFRDKLRTLLSCRSRWTTHSSESWLAKGVSIFKKSPSSIVSLCANDVLSCQTRYISPDHYGTNVGYNNEQIGAQYLADHGEAAWRQLLSGVLMRSLPESPHTRLQPSGVLEKDRYAVHGSILSPDGAKKLCEYETPRYNVWDESFEWKSHPDSDSTMEIYITCTHAGYVTQPHDDGPGLDSYVWHVSGIKLWIVWDASPSNVYKVTNNNPRAEDLKWCLDNLDDAKVGV
jgi:hypothetical protein